MDKTANNGCDHESIGKKQSYYLLSQMFEDEKLNKAAGKFEKEYNNKPYEYVRVIANNGEIILPSHTSNLHNTVTIPKNIEKLGFEHGLMAIIHNHTNGVPLPSHRDVYKAMTLKAKNLVSTTSGKYNSLLVNNDRSKIKDINELKTKAIKVQDNVVNIENEMIDNFVKSNLQKYESMNPNSNKFKNDISEYYQKYENMEYYFKKFQEVLPTNMKLRLYNKNTNNYI
jgi:hypothetical protein